jgi:hypothetical protein
MTSRDRIGQRAQAIYTFLNLHRGEGYTLPELCKELDITPASTTRAAITRARDLATEAGLHFPPAVPQNGHRYMVTELAADAVDPTLHMTRIEAGVRRRKEDGIEFLRRERRHLPPDLKPIATYMVKTYDTTRRAIGELQRAADDMVMELVKVRKGQRDGSADE